MSCKFTFHLLLQLLLFVTVYGQIEWTEFSIEENTVAHAEGGGDLDGDGDFDVIFVVSPSVSLSPWIGWYENINGDGTVWVQHLTCDFPNYYSVHLEDVLDLESDGDLDLLVRLYNGQDMNSICSIRNDGNGPVSSQTVFRYFSLYSTSHDLDNDGDLDLLVSDFGDLHWLINDGNGNEWEAVFTGQYGYDCTAIDVDIDGDVDFFSTAYPDGIRFHQYLDTVNHEWNSIDLSLIGVNPTAVDLYNDNSTYVYMIEDGFIVSYNLVSTDPLEYEVIQTGIECSNYKLVDIDVDGFKDLVCFHVGVIEIYTNPGQPSLEWERELVEIPSEYCLLDDIDNDGDVDAIVNITNDNGNDNNIIWLSNTDTDVSLQPMVADTTHPCFVNVIFQALSQFGKGVTGLGSLSNFFIRENDAEISALESMPTLGQMEDIPYLQRTVLMLDNSFSVGTHLEDVKAAAVSAIRERFTKQQISVWTFSEDVVEIHPFSEDTTSLIEAVNGVTVGSPSTDLYGAVVQGCAELVDSVSTQGILQSSMLLVTDGEDTQGSTSFSEATDAVTGRRVYAVGVGDGVDHDVLEQIGTAGYSNAEFSTLEMFFASIQDDITDFANSFYWLTYLSPSRNNSNCELEIDLLQYSGDNMFVVGFSSSGFSSVDPGVYVNRSYVDMLGIDEYVVDGVGTSNFLAETLFGLEDPQYEWTLVPEGYYHIVNISGPGNSIAEVAPIEGGGVNATLTVVDTENGFSKVVQLIPNNSDVVDVVNPVRFGVTSAFPNPFNQIIKIDYVIPDMSMVNLSVYNISGQIVLSEITTHQPAGEYSKSLVFEDLSSGVYLVCLSDGRQSDVKKVLLVK